MSNLIRHPLLGLLLTCLCLLSNASAVAQTSGDPASRSRAVVGGSSGAPSQPKMISGSQGSDILRHRNATGRPCLDVLGFVRPLSPSSKLLDHVIVGANSCNDLIRAEVCYFRSQQCIPLEVPGRSRKEVILGTAMMKDFNFEFRERF